MRRALAILLLTALLTAAFSTQASAQVRLDAVPVLTGLFNAYAPTLVGTRMWIAGWLTAADVPDDKIYRSDLVAGSWTFPVLSFERPEAGINDPSVVITPAGTTLLYFTSIDKQCTPQPNCYLTHNLTGVASSANGGVGWTDGGILIPMNNGAGHCGAWAPSALMVGEEVWVYYHGGNPSFGLCEHPTGTVFRSRFDRTGTAWIDTVVVPLPLPAVNVDVSLRPGGGFVMVANSPDLTKLHRFVSANGLAWTPAPAGPLFDAGQVWIPTPHITWVDATHFDVWLGSGQVVGNTFIHQVERWGWAE